MTAKSKIQVCSNKHETGLVKLFMLNTTDIKFILLINAKMPTVVIDANASIYRQDKYNMFSVCRVSLWHFTAVQWLMLCFISTGFQQTVMALSVK